MMSGSSKLKNNPPLETNSRFLVHYLRPHFVPIIISSVLAAVSVLLSAWPIKIVERLVNAFKNGQSTPEFILHSVLLIMGLALAGGIMLFFQRKIITLRSRVMEYEIRRDFLDYLQHQTAPFYLKNRTGDIMSRATNDLSQIREMIGAGILHMLRTVLNLIVIISMMVSTHPVYALIVLLPVSVLPLFSVRMLRRMGKQYADVQARLSVINNITQETFAGISIIKAYGRESWRYDKFKEANDAYFASNMTVAKMAGLIWPLFAFIASFSTILLLFFGGRAVIAHTLSLGSLVALNFYLLMLYWPLIAFGWVFNLFQRGLASTQRIRQLLEQPVFNAPGGARAFSAGDILIRDLTFTYPGRVIPALKNLNLRIPQGSRTALVGTVGSGKTTLANLIARIYAPPPGTISINGHDALDIEIGAYRDHLTLVPQETLLFSDTIRENIRFGLPVDENAIAKAIQISRFEKDLKEIPHGLDQILGERGINLSGGQKQRVAIARAVLRNPDFIVLDDCLSAVDAGTEMEILEEFESFFIGRTSLIISHRISAVRTADFIYVLDQGEIVEQGTHSELIRKDGLYVQLYEQQKLIEGTSDAA